MVNPVEFWPASNVEIERLKHNARVDRQKIAVVVVEGILKVDFEYCHGMHVTEDLSPGKSSPSFNSESSITTGGSSASALSRKAQSSSLTTSYRIWRTWEECLIFQSILERRYKDLAKAKRASLRKETSSLKTVKSHTRSESGIYSSSTSASSFASLPTGADLRMIAKDVHHIVPKLTIKQSLFSTSPAGVAKQNDQLILFIKSLWGEDLIEEDLPMLFSQLKEDDEVRDFFSFRYSDRDITVKHGLQFNPELNGTLGLRRSVSSFTDSDRQSIASFATSSSSSDSSLRTRRRSMINMLRRPPESLTIKSLENTEQQQVDRVSIYDPESRGEIHDWRYITHAIAEDPYEEEGELQVKDMTENNVDSRFSKPLPEIDEYCLPTFNPYGAQEDNTIVSNTVSILSNSYVPGDHVLEDPQLINAFFMSKENGDSIMLTCPLATSTYGTIPESDAIFRPHVLVAEAEEYEFGADTPTHLSFVSTAKFQHSRQISSASTIVESRESDNDADSLMDAFAFASLNSPIKAPNSRPTSIVSYTSTGSIRDLGCLPDTQ